MSLLDLQIKSEYRSLSDNIVKDFYIPLLKEAVLYKRAVGFFSSSALIEISKGISGLIQNNGRIMLIVSPRLQDDDVEAINKGYKERDVIIQEALVRSFTEPKNFFETERLNLLANLIADGMLDIKVAFAENNNKLGIFHEKMGLIYDNENNVVAFTGSMNETGMAFYHNYEAVDVFCSWKSKDNLERVCNKELAFKNLWNNIEHNVEVIEFPQVAYDKLQAYKKETVNLYVQDDEENQYFCVSESIELNSIQPNIPIKPESISYYDYQLDAISKWAMYGYKGIFDMATGTGKTITGLGAVVNLYNYCNGNLAVIIVCPYQHLVEQWVEDIRSFNIIPIIGYSGSAQSDYKKRLKLAVYDYSLNIKKFFCFICTNATFSLDYIQSQVTKLKGNVLLVVDEAHNFGATNLSKTLNETYGYRLALSATLDRHNDEEGTQKLRYFFGEKCIEYTLERAIRENKLTPYKYYPEVVTLSPDELELYNTLTREMGKCIIKDKSGKTYLSEKGKMLALKRSRLVAGAIGKVDLLCEKIFPYRQESHILVYCGATNLLNQEYDDDIDDIRQIDFITKKLGNDLGMKVSQFTSKENNVERAVLKTEFEKGENLQTLIAIKCLDEGVNIPKIRIAFILASTTNPKEYIQRRGRVLRKAQGKEFAVIYDFITLPRSLNEVRSLTLEEVQRDKSLVKAELRRIQEFKDLSINPMDSDKLINDIFDAYDLYDYLEDEILGL